MTDTPTQPSDDDVSIPRALLEEIAEAMDQAAAILADLARKSIELFPHGDQAADKLLVEWGTVSFSLLAKADRLHKMLAVEPIESRPVPSYEIDPANLMDREQLLEVLKDPPAKYYVYCLIDRQDKVFYYGKGTGLRVLEHEREVLFKNLGRHTNWKKLNKIAALTRSGTPIRYLIDSWHDSEQSAFAREDSLQLPYLTCNWGGHVKPSKALLAIRSAHGLDTFDARHGTHYRASEGNDDSA